MISLPNDCSCCYLSVHPKNWQSKNAKISFGWYIMYRFYDPRHGKPKLISVKRMNQFKNLLERQMLPNWLYPEKDKLVKGSYNPFLKPQKKVNPMDATGLDKQKSKQLADKLNILLANYSIFYQNTRGFHSHIKGEKFFKLHAKFKELYCDLLLKIDEGAERILTLGFAPGHIIRNMLKFQP